MERRTWRDRFDDFIATGKDAAIPLACFIILMATMAVALHLLTSKLVSD